MAYKRYLVEFGSAADIHGGDVTLASKRAVRDAISHCCMCGLSDIFGLQPGKMKLDLVIFVPYPEKVNQEEVKKELPSGEVNLTVNEGGLKVRGLHVEKLGPGDEIVMANAAITVWIDID